MKCWEGSKASGIVWSSNSMMSPRSWVVFYSAFCDVSFIVFILSMTFFWIKIELPTTSVSREEFSFFSFWSGCVSWLLSPGNRVEGRGWWVLLLNQLAGLLFLLFPSPFLFAITRVLCYGITSFPFSCLSLCSGEEEGCLVLWEGRWNQGKFYHLGEQRSASSPHESHCCLKGSLEAPSSEPLSLGPWVGEMAPIIEAQVAPFSSLSSCFHLLSNLQQIVVVHQLRLLLHSLYPYESVTFFFCLLQFGTDSRVKEYLNGDWFSIVVIIV